MKKYYNVVYTLTKLQQGFSTQVHTLYVTDNLFIPAKFCREEAQIVKKEMSDLPIYVNPDNTFRIVPTFWTEITEEEAKQIEAYRD